MKNREAVEGGPIPGRAPIDGPPNGGSYVQDLKTASVSRKHPGPGLRVDGRPGRPPGWTFGELGRTAWLFVSGEWWPGASPASRKAGCTIDPNGAPRSVMAPKLGCSIDPNGVTRCDPSTRHGCSIDPNGETHCDPAPKAGCTIDPDGASRCDPASKHGCSIDPDGSRR